MPEPRCLNQWLNWGTKRRHGALLVRRNKSPDNRLQRNGNFGALTSKSCRADWRSSWRSSRSSQKWAQYRAENSMLPEARNGQLSPSSCEAPRSTSKRIPECNCRPAECRATPVQGSSSVAIRSVWGWAATQPSISIHKAKLAPTKRFRRRTSCVSLKEVSERALHQHTLGVARKQRDDRIAHSSCRAQNSVNSCSN